MTRDRLDKTLVQLGHTQTRSQAAQLIKDGKVQVLGLVVKKASQIVDESEISLSGEVEFVGRGAKKIEGAFTLFSIDLKDKLIADVGASTGGFTDYVLKNGARKVFAIDVGHDQLAKSLREDSRVVNMEGINIRHPLELEVKVDLAVVDLSYISLRLTFKTIFSLLKKNGKVVALVKPQFEVGKKLVGKNGIVKDNQVRISMLKDLKFWCKENSYFIKNAMKSPIEGKGGNVEYFFIFDKNLNEHQVSDRELECL